jgi:hypothetical protein
MKKHVTALAALAAGAVLLTSARGGAGSESAAEEPAAGAAEAANMIRISATDFAFKPRSVALSAPGT